ncbi:MAG: response regulator transcription factor [Xylanivirga thermophila]|jgi:DNA-binding response OmpR family regulator|uniref:response regulator transcription factor n=1 Tax=Xylanivirga thermophila TaxID=2496273 RepID=UPI00101D7B9E|nr:response regulator transcription factor [Xylanivirga thermophila]
MRILLVEDEKQLAESLAQILKKNNYIVDNAYDGETGLDSALSDIYDIIILDIMLPKLDGLSILRQIREGNINTPILMLTARSDVRDKVKGLDLGADDYLAKPFYSEELLARIRALSRRKGEFIPDDIISYKDLTLDLSNMELSTSKNKVRLSLKEFELMQHFLSNPDSIAQKEFLIVKVWGYDSDAEYNNLEVYISFLRKKLVAIKSKVRIVTIRNVGYKLEA